MASVQPAPERSLYGPAAQGPTSAPSLTLAELRPSKLVRGWQAANLAAGLGALAALIVAVATGLPLLGFFVWMLGGGMLAVVIYRRRQPFPSLTAATGARLGARAGVMGFVIVGLLSLAQVASLRGSGQLRAALEQALKASAAHSGNPEAQQMVQQFLTPEGMRLFLALGIVLMLVMFVAVSSLGGAIAAALSRKRETRTL